MKAIYLFTFVFLIVFMFSFNQVSAVTINNPNLPLVQSETAATANINNNTLNVNNSAFLQGLIPQQVANLYQENTTYHYNFSDYHTNFAYLNNSQTFTNNNTFNGFVTIFNVSSFLANQSSGQIRIGIPRGTQQFTNDAFRKAIKFWIADVNNLTTSGTRISVTSRSDTNITPIFDLSSDYEGGAAFGSVWRFTVARTSTANNNMQLCLQGYRMESTGALTVQGDPIQCWFIDQTNVAGSAIFPGPVRNLSVESAPYASLYGNTDNQTGGLDVIKKGPGQKGLSRTGFIPFTWDNNSVTSHTKLLIKQADNCGDGTSCNLDKTVGAILSKNGGQWVFGGDLNGSNNATGTFLGTVNISKSGNLTVEGFITTAKNYTVNSLQGLTINLNMLNASNVSCFQNFTGGILTWTNC